MNEQEFETRLTDLMGQIDELPEEQREQVQKFAAETRTRHDKIRSTIKGLQESMDYLRLSVKYLVFDLEATRRENDFLRKMIDKGNDGSADNA